MDIQQLREDLRAALELVKNSAPVFPVQTPGSPATLASPGLGGRREGTPCSIDGIILPAGSSPKPPVVKRDFVPARDVPEPLQPFGGDEPPNGFIKAAQAVSTSLDFAYMGTWHSSLFTIDVI